MSPESLKKYLTERQYEVLELIYLGYSREEIRKMLVPPVTLQAIHQIVPRIRKRLRDAGIIPKNFDKRPKKFLFKK